MAVEFSNGASDLSAAPCVESRSPVAFDIPVRSPEKGDFKSPVKARLESYSSKSPVSGRPNPLLNVPSPCANRLKKEVAAEKARDANAKKREAAEKVKAAIETAAESKRRDIDRDLDEKQQRRDARLLKVASPKGKEGKIAAFHEQESQAAMERKAKIEDSLVQKEEKRKEVIEKAQARAVQHNQKVYQKKKSLEQEQHDKQEELRQKVAQKKGSKVSGECFSQVGKSRPALASTDAMVPDRKFHIIEAAAVAELDEREPEGVPSSDRNACLAGILRFLPCR